MFLRHQVENCHTIKGLTFHSWEEWWLRILSGKGRERVRGGRGGHGEVIEVVGKSRQGGGRTRVTG